MRRATRRERRAVDEALRTLFAELDQSTATLAKVDALKRYFADAAPRDAAWAVYFLAGGKPRQVVPSGVLWAIACRKAGIDDWLFDACYQAVGDFAETVAHVLPPPAHESDLGLAEWVEERLLTCAVLPPKSRRCASRRTGTSSTRPGASCSTS
jgi:DNA ligase-1